MSWKSQVISDRELARRHLPDGELCRTVVDEFNKWKCWHIVRRKSRHYALIQTVKGSVTGCIKRSSLEAIEVVTGHKYTPMYWRNQRRGG